MSSLRPSQASLLRKYGLRPDKRLGQHFLTDARVLARIVDSVRALGPERVVELGSGAGALTFALVDAGWPVTALELDPKMVELLGAETREDPVEIERVDLAREDLTRHVGPVPTVFAGNLPYQITSPLLFALRPALQLPQARGAVVMMQAEVAERLSARPGGRDYGVLTVLLGATLSIRRLFTVRPGCFLPPPAVDSAVVELRPRPDPVALGESGERLVKALFAERRKQIGGLLRRRHDLPADALARLDTELGIRPTQRAETLGLEDFVRLDGWLRAQGGATR